MIVHKLLVAMVIISRPLSSSMVAACHVEGARRRASGLVSSLICMRTMPGLALILRMLRLRSAVQKLIVAMLLVFLGFVMLLGVAGSLLHGPARVLLVLQR